MDHDHDANCTSCQTPRRLPCNLGSSFFVLVRNIEHLAEVLPQIMRCRTLNGATRTTDVGFYSSCRVPASELFFFCLSSLDYWNSQKIFVHTPIQFQCLHHHDISIFISGMCRMSFLPQKFSTAKERSWILELPSDNITPLIQFEWQVTMTLDPIRKGWVHDGFRCWTNCNGFREFAISTLGHPSYFWGKSFHVIFLLLQPILRNKEWKVTILYTKLSNLKTEGADKKQTHFGVRQSQSIQICSWQQLLMLLPRH